MRKYDESLNTRLTPRPFRAFALPGLVLLSMVTVFLVSACGGSGGSSGGSVAVGCNLTLEDLNNLGSASPECLALLPDPESTLNPKIYILGSETDLNGNLHIYVQGVSADNVPLVLDDFQTATVVTVDETVLLNNGADVNGGGVTVQAIADGSPISIAFLTDYSASMSEVNLNQIGQAYALILNALPAGFEAQVLNFSNDTAVRQDWTQDLQALLTAVQFDPAFAPRSNTALYDGIRDTLYRSDQVDGFGLSERCRPVRLLITHTDGLENFSDPGTFKADLITEMDTSRTIAIMLGTVTANVPELEEFAGDRGAFVYAYDVNGIRAAVSGWAGSFDSIVEFVIDAGLFNVDVPGKVEIGLGSLSGMVEAPYDQPCIQTP